MGYKVVCLVLALAVAASAAPETRIVGGTPITIRDFPYIVAITYKYPDIGLTLQRCVGSLISSYHVLTSGFCFVGANLEDMYVRAGSTYSLSGGVEVPVTRFERHPDFVNLPRVADIAVLFLAYPLPIAGDINVLYLPAPDTYIPDWQTIKIVSWGYETESGTEQLNSMNSIVVNKIPQDECYNAFLGSNRVRINDNVICATAPGKGICRADSGAPSVVGDVLVGVASFYQECGDDGYPDVLTRVDKYTSWILEVATAPDSDGTPVRVAKV